MDEKAVDLWKGTAAGTNSTEVVVDEIEKDVSDNPRTSQIIIREF